MLRVVLFATAFLSSMENRTLFECFSIGSIGSQRIPKPLELRTLPVIRSARDNYVILLQVSGKPTTPAAPTFPNTPSKYTIVLHHRFATLSDDPDQLGDLARGLRWYSL